jgi:hypothetical protein
VSKVIAIPENFSDLEKKLKARGYEVVHVEYEGYVDAILYDSDQSSLSYLNNFDNVIDMDKGAMIINIKNKGIDEIIDMIEKRTYESIF